MTAAWAVRGAATAAFSAVLCAALIVVLRPALQRYALAKPNARSSHREPTPQGGGIAVVAATIAAAWLGMFGLGAAIAPPPGSVLAAVVLMAMIGGVDDIRSIEIIPRLLLQALAVAAVIYALPDDLRVASFLPWWLERLLLFVGGLWFVNLVNFMDGIDWMTVVEVVPLTAALAVLGALGALAAYGVVVALALGGAMIGFGYFNRPVARTLPRRCRLSRYRFDPGMADRSGRRRRPPRRCVAVAALLSRRHGDHPAAPSSAARADLAGPPDAFLSTCDTARPDGHRRCRPRIRRQRRSVRSCGDDGDYTQPHQRGRGTVRRRSTRRVAPCRVRTREEMNGQRLRSSGHETGQSCGDLIGVEMMAFHIEMNAVVVEIFAVHRRNCSVQVQHVKS